MIKNILAVVAGLAVSMVLIIGVESLGHLIHPAPEGLDMDAIDFREKICAHMESAPLAAMLLVCLGYIVGSFGGGFTTAKIAANRQQRLALVIGVALTIMTILNFNMLPCHPIWMWGVLLFIAPAAYYGWKMSGMPKDSRNG